MSEKELKLTLDTSWEELENALGYGLANLIRASNAEIENLKKDTVLKLTGFKDSDVNSITELLLKHQDKKISNYKNSKAVLDWKYFKDYKSEDDVIKNNRLDRKDYRLLEATKEKFWSGGDSSRKNQLPTKSELTHEDMFRYYNAQGQLISTPLQLLTKYDGERGLRNRISKYSNLSPYEIPLLDVIKEVYLKDPEEGIRDKVGYNPELFLALLKSDNTVTEDNYYDKAYAAGKRAKLSNLALADMALKIALGAVGFAGMGALGGIRAVLNNPVGKSFIINPLKNVGKSFITNPLKNVGFMVGSEAADKALEAAGLENKYIRSAASALVGGGIGGAIGNKLTQKAATFLLGNSATTKWGMPAILEVMGGKDPYVKAADKFINKTQLGNLLFESDATATTPVIQSAGKLGNAILGNVPYVLANGAPAAIGSLGVELAESLMDPNITSNPLYNFSKAVLLSNISKAANNYVGTLVKLNSKGASNLVEVGENLNKPGTFTGSIVVTSKNGINSNKINLKSDFMDRSNIQLGYVDLERGLDMPLVTRTGKFIVGLEIPKIDKNKLTLEELNRLLAMSKGSKHNPGTLINSVTPNYSLLLLRLNGITAQDLANSTVHVISKLHPDAKGGKVVRRSTNELLVSHDGKLNVKGLHDADAHDNDFILKDLGNGDYYTVNAAGHLVQNLNLPGNKKLKWKDAAGEHTTNQILIATDDPGYSRTLSKYNGAGQKFYSLLGGWGGRYLDLNSSLHHTTAILPERIILKLLPPVLKVPNLPRYGPTWLYNMLVEKTVLGYPGLHERGLNVTGKSISFRNYNRLSPRVLGYFHPVYTKDGKREFRYNPDNTVNGKSTVNSVLEGIMSNIKK